MSELKFSCPACGQHLSGDVGYAGLQITCPACQRTITVPGPEPVTAARAVPRAATPPPLPPSVPARSDAAAGPAPAAEPFAKRAAPTTSGLAVASLVCSLLGPLGAVAGVICGHLARRQMRRDPSLGGRGLATAGLIVGYSFLVLGAGAITLSTLTYLKHLKEGRRSAVPPAVTARDSGERIAPGAVTPADAATDNSGWTLQLDSVEIPAQPVQGRLHGRPFTPEQVVLQNGWLKFRQGGNVFADLELSVVLFEEDPAKLAERTFKVPGSQSAKPHVWLHWKEPDQRVPQGKAFMDHYALRLELGPVRDGKLSGKIYVCVEDEKRSFLRGTFEAEVKPTTAPPRRPPPRQRVPGVPADKASRAMADPKDAQRSGSGWES